MALICTGGARRPGPFWNVCPPMHQPTHFPKIPKQAEGSQRMRPWLDCRVTGRDWAHPGSTGGHTRA